MNIPSASARRHRPACPDRATEAEGRTPASGPPELGRRHGRRVRLGRLRQSRRPQAPPWAYSVGMWLTCQAPELIVCGLPVENAASIINAIGARAADGVDIAPASCSTTSARRRLRSARST